MQDTPQDLPRDVVNALLLKEALITRSRSRGDAETIMRWMGKQFQRWIVTTFEHVTRLQTIDDFEKLTGSIPPDWLVQKLESQSHENTTEQLLVLIDPNHPYLLELEQRCVEWLRTRLSTLDEKKFPRFTPPFVLANWRKDHDRMEKISLSGFLETSGKARISVLKRKKYRIVEFDPKAQEFRKELNNESVNMGHCLGQFASQDTLTGGYGEGYAALTEQGKMRLFSLRDTQGKPHVTISLQKTEEDGWQVEQVKGKQNRPPVFKYTETVRQFLNHIGVVAKPHDDCFLAGIFVEEGKYISAKDIKDVDRQYEIAAFMPTATNDMVVQNDGLKWFCLSRSVETLKNIKNVGDMMRITAALLAKEGTEILQDPTEKERSLAKGMGCGKIEGESFRLPLLSEWADKV